jgi:hypothetical protein
MVTASKLPVDSNASATEMAETIFGDGVTVLNASYSGDGAASGIFSDGDTIAPGATPGDSGVILSTGRADDYTNSPGNGPPWAWWLSDDANQQSDTSTNTNGADGNPAFDAAAGAATFEADDHEVHLRVGGISRICHRLFPGFRRCVGERQPGSNHRW